MELNELRKIAEAATPGPWEWEEPSKYDWPTEDESLVQSDGNEVVLSGWGYDASGTEAEDVDRAHIATFDPPTVLALITRLEQAEQDRVKLRNRLDAMRRQRDGYRNQLRKTEQQIQKVREVVGEDAPSFFTNEAMHAYAKAMSEITRALDGDGRD